MTNIKTKAIQQSKRRKIPFWTIEETHIIWVRVRRKRRLTDLYPQRAILEEARKDSVLGKVNDWIDHDYYEQLVEDADQKNARLVEKYSPKANSDTAPFVPPAKTIPVPQVNDPLFNRIPN